MGATTAAVPAPKTSSTVPRSRPSRSSSTVIAPLLYGQPGIQCQGQQTVPRDPVQQRVTNGGVTQFSIDYTEEVHHAHFLQIPMLQGHPSR